MKSSYLCLIGCVAALNFSVYSAQISAKTMFEGFSGNVSKILTESKKAGYKNAFDAAVEKVDVKLKAKQLTEFAGWDADQVIEWLISSQPQELHIVPGKSFRPGEARKVYEIIGRSDKDLEDLRSAYYERFIINTFGVEFADLQGSKKVTPKQKIDYTMEMDEANKGDLQHLTALWSIYENYKNSNSYFKKIVGSVSAFLAAVCANNDLKVNLTKIKGGIDVYKCLLNLGFDQIDHEVQKDKDEMTFAKLLEILPDFMEDLQSKKLVDKVIKAKEEVNEPKKEKKQEDADKAPTKRKGMTGLNQKKNPTPTPAGGDKKPVVKQGTKKGQGGLF